MEESWGSGYVERQGDWNRDSEKVRRARGVIGTGGHKEETNEGSALRLGLRSLSQPGVSVRSCTREGHSLTTSPIHRFVSRAGATLILQSTVHKNCQTHWNTNMASFQGRLH